MKITICAYDAPNNIDGPTTWLKRLLPYLRNQGIETRILFLATKTKNLGTVAYFKSLHFKCRLIPAELFFEEQLQLILEDLVAYPPDVFIPNYFPVAGYVNRYSKRAGIPSVMILHNDDFYHRSLVEEFGSGNGAASLSCIVPVSKLLDKAIRELHLPDVMVSCIPYGAPVPTATAKWRKGEKLRLIYLGRLNNNQKRISEVAKAFCRVTKELTDVEATIYGNGPALQEVLDILAKEGKESAVSYGGVLELSELQTKLLEHHVYVLLSEYEGIPVALMEAMACGLVPVCSNIKSGIAELVTDSVNGLIVRDRNDAFAEAISGLQSNPEQWSTLSGTARLTIEKEYGEEDCYRKWVTLLKTLAAQNKFAGSLLVPSINELKKLAVPQHFLTAEVRMPHPVIAPLIRLKKIAGRLKRNNFN